MIYFLHFEYFATCEGLTVSFGILRANSPEEAAVNFVKKIFGEPIETATIDYFKAGVQAFDLSDEKALSETREILEKFLVKREVDRILEAKKDHALCEFLYHSYINYS